MPDAPFPEDMMDDICCFFKNTHPTLTPGEDVYPAVFHSARFYPLQRMRETARMMRIARSIDPRTVMEIGADKGGGVYHFCQCLPTVKNVIACEVRGTPYAGEFERAFPDKRFFFVPASSHEQGTPHIVAGWLDDLGRAVSGPSPTIDVLFIDGDKGAFDRDFNAYLPMMSKDGIVFMHDTDGGPMRAAFLAAGRKYQTEQIIDRTESAEALAREQRREPATTPYESWLRHWKGRSCTVGVIYLGRPK